MIGERLKEIIEVSDKPPNWPAYYVVTNSGSYEYTGQRFVKRDAIPEGSPVQIPTRCFDRVIKEVRGDGESAVILLDSGDKIAFDLAHDPFGPVIEAWPIVRCYSAKEARLWEDEYEQMDPLF